MNERSVANSDRDEEFLITFYQQIYPRIRGWLNTKISARLRNRLSASDLIQSTMKSLIKDGKPIGDSKQFWCWFWTKLRDKHVEAIRTHAGAKKRTMDLETTEVDPGTLTQTNPDLDQSFVEEFLESVPVPVREVLLLKLEGYTNVEITEITGLNKRSISRLLSDAKSLLHDQPDH